MRTTHEFIREYGVEIALYAVIVVLLVLVGIAVVDERAQWKLYQIRFNCQAFSKIPPTQVKKPTTDGVAMTVATEGKTGYRCDDGTEHWR